MSAFDDFDELLNEIEGFDEVDILDTKKKDLQETDEDEDEILISLKKENLRLKEELEKSRNTPSKEYSQEFTELLRESRSFLLKDLEYDREMKELKRLRKESADEYKDMGVSITAARKAWKKVQDSFKEDPDLADQREQFERLINEDSTLISELTADLDDE